ncbi:MAG: hypothetical protein OEW33_08435 [Nitrospirota bacterium]|jgi:hypothetical protein|nr:hypothetical protein [Nitrospirota bacterium]MDH4360751.1 hypothetical protein [Nitrospirota bacterium]MDH5296452.1 hypothetical protein [Nitrospirota bacterium]
MSYIFFLIFRPALRLLLSAVIFLVSQGQGSAHEQDILHIRLDPRPFSPALCQSAGQDKAIRIQVAKYRDLTVRQVPGQYKPSELSQARTKNYVHFLSLHDLTDGVVTRGAIAFDRDHAVIFTPEHPKGLARRKFIDTLPQSQQQIGEAALNTFLRLRPALNAAVDTCRPYPPFVTYGSDDEIDRIEAARRTFAQRVHRFNTDPTTSPGFALPESGISDGFVDPDAGRNTNVSYQALNPLNFYVPSH